MVVFEYDDGEACCDDYGDAFGAVSDSPKGGVGPSERAFVRLVGARR